MERANTVGVALVILLVLGASLAVLRPIAPDRAAYTSVTQYDPTRESASGVVVGRLETGGISLFGITFGRISRTASVRILVPPGCGERVAVGDSWPSPFEDCVTTSPIAGVVSGGGVSTGGESILVVDVVVGERCYESIGRGDTWPPATGACP